MTFQFWGKCPKHGWVVPQPFGNPDVATCPICGRVLGIRSYYEDREAEAYEEAYEEAIDQLEILEAIDEALKDARTRGLI